MSYFNHLKIINVDDLIHCKYKIYAHKKDNHKETLKEHTERCIKYFMKVSMELGIDEIFKRVEKKFFINNSDQEKQLFREMLINTIALHDIGKVNVNFQKDKMENKINIQEAKQFSNSNHSMLSAIIYIDFFMKKIMNIDKKNIRLFLDFMLLNAYSITRHHGDIKDYKTFKEKFNEDEEGEKLLGTQRYLYKDLLNFEMKLKLKNIKAFFNESEKYEYTKEQKIFKYIYMRLMMSMIFTSDYYATTEYMDQLEIINSGRLHEIEEFFKTYREGNIYKSIRRYENSRLSENELKEIKDINIMRSELFIDTETKIEQHYCSNLFFLEAPTGSGKSNAALNLSFKLIQNIDDLSKIFYIYPFNTLVEQNMNSFEDVFGDKSTMLDKISVINSIEPVKMDRLFEEDKSNCSEYYKKALLNRQFLNYPITLTTHVTLFKYLFGTKKEDLFPLHQMINSVIVLDEIQSYKNSIWSEIITFLNCYAELLNMKVIIMSATLPDLQKLSLVESRYTRLIGDREKFFAHKLFKDRVNVDFSLLDIECDLLKLMEHVKEKTGKKVLVEFIKKQSAYDFYNMLRDDYSINTKIELITGDDNLGERKRIIDLVKTSDEIILVATQVIEAGVDIDMDIGYKNISMLDCEEQFLGRINRSCKKSGKVYFFKLDEAKGIYKNDVRMNHDLSIENHDMQNILRCKNFDEYYDLVLERLKDKGKKFNEDNIEQFFEALVGNGEYHQIEKRMELISDQIKRTVIFLNTENVQFKGELINGEEVWNNYKQLLKDNKIDYAEKMVKLSEIKSKMNNFLYEIKWNDNLVYNDRIGEIYYIEDGESYMKEGKLNKKILEEGIGGFI